MRFRIVFALLLSAVLITGAAWVRAAGQREAPALVGIDGARDTGDAVYAGAYSPEDSSGGDTSDNLTTTDLVGRQLILDYVNLATSGEATEASLAALASQYVEIIPTLGQAPHIGITDVTIVENSTSNLAAYRDSLTLIRTELEKSIEKLESSSSGISGTGAELYSFAAKIGSAYDKAALKVRDLEVPHALSDSHLKLANNYLSTATAFRAVSDLDKDSASAFAGIVALSENLNQEGAIFMEISRILIQHGV